MNVARNVICPRLRSDLLACIIAFLLMSSHATAVDLVRAETRTDEAVSLYGVSGSGVIVAVLDRGIDWTHDDFRNPDGTTRIKWMLDMTGFSLCDVGNPAALEFSEPEEYVRGVDSVAWDVDPDGRVFAAKRRPSPQLRIRLGTLR